MSFGTWGFKSPFAHLFERQSPGFGRGFSVGLSPRRLVAAGAAALVMPRCSYSVAARVRAPFPAGVVANLALNILTNYFNVLAKVDNDWPVVSL